jgi:hypothetical protein
MTLTANPPPTSRYKSVDARQRPFLVAGELQCMVQAFGLSIIKYSDFNRSGVKYITVRRAGRHARGPAVVCCGMTSSVG